MLEPMDASVRVPGLRASATALMLAARPRRSRSSTSGTTRLRTRSPPRRAHGEPGAPGAKPLARLAHSLQPRTRHGSRGRLETASTIRIGAPTMRAPL